MRKETKSLWTAPIFSSSGHMLELYLIMQSIKSE